MIRIIGVLAGVSRRRLIQFLDDAFHVNIALTMFRDATQAIDFVMQHFLAPTEKIFGDLERDFERNRKLSALFIARVKRLLLFKFIH